MALNVTKNACHTNCKIYICRHNSTSIHPPSRLMANWSTSNINHQLECISLTSLGDKRATTAAKTLTTFWAWSSPCVSSVEIKKGSTNETQFQNPPSITRVQWAHKNKAKWMIKLCCDNKQRSKGTGQVKTNGALKNTHLFKITSHTCAQGGEQQPQTQAQIYIPPPTAANRVWRPHITDFLSARQHRCQKDGFCWWT